MESPPKRVTRARAAKVTEPGLKTTRIVTAAARAKSTAASSSATAGTKSTAAKRKTRSDESDDDSEHEEVAARRATRGRPRKTVQADDELAAAPAPAPAKTTRARATKKTTVETAKDEPAAPKPTRGRPKKVVEPVEEDAASEPLKKVTRARAGTTSKATSSTAATKSTAKKSVKFEEPDKENMDHPTKGESAITSLRGRSGRRGGAAGVRSARTVTKASGVGSKKPLSPKKVTQMPFSRDRDSSEDELAAVEKKAAVKPMMKNPIKPPVSPKKPEVHMETDNTIEVNAAVLNPPEFGASVLASPPRRLPASPLKDSMRSPAKRVGLTLPGSAMKPANTPGQLASSSTPFKSSLLQSAARRPQSAIKGLNFGSPSKSQNPQSALKNTMFQSPAKRAFPGFKELNESRKQEFNGSPAMKPLAVATPTGSRPSEKLMVEEAEGSHSPEAVEEELFSNPIGNIQFSGRLSAVLPRDADPAFDEEMSAVHEEEEEPLQLVESMPEFDDIDANDEVEVEAEPTATVAWEDTVVAPVTEVASETDDFMGLDVAIEAEDRVKSPVPESKKSPQASAQQENPMYQLREKDLDHGYESDSEDDLSPSKNRRRSHSPKKQSRRSTMGISSLAEKFGSWSTRGSMTGLDGLASEPTADNNELVVATETQSPDATLAAQDPTIQNNFFDDEMVVRNDDIPEDARAEAVKLAEEEAVDEAFADVMVIDEDVALAEEANEMSLLETEQAEGIAPLQSFDSVSEASQEYGDENQMPVDPALQDPQTSLGVVTPVRPVHRTFHTTTKIPLKPADESTPSPLKKRSFSASRVAPRRPVGPSRNATVISYSPKKERRQSFYGEAEAAPILSAPSTPSPITPGKTDLWSSMGTPARTPRKDINPALLRGAIVFVDVHTSEGADASGIFVELLTQMGARCMKSWSWNPNSPQNGESSSAKVGITHVVYKDGGKRTMEKIREANGVVQCVGVSWVLDCERENQWLEEAPYYIDTSMVPRGGARRRKSMEPKALANLNGTLVSSPTKNNNGLTPGTPMNRRQSTVWMHTPSDQGEEDKDDVDWSQFILTPVPKTPAPEAVARYAAEVPETPSPSVGDEELMNSPADQALLMRTCPPKASVYQNMGEGIIGRDKDEQVVLRLMAARRKSLQFAPKVGSPLARAWK